MEQETGPKKSGPDIIQAFMAYIEELTLEARRSREKMEEEKAQSAKASRWHRFWRWWRDYNSGLTALVTILSILIGGAWAVKQYRDTEREKTEQRQREIQLQRNAAIAQYSSQLSDTKTRNSAAYALATVAREDALPQLLSMLRETTDSAEDQSFRKAIAQALIVIGEPAVNAVLQLNREIMAKAGPIRQLTPEQTNLLAAIQPVLEDYFFKRMSSNSATPPKDFSGVFIREINLEDYSLKGLVLRKAVLEKGNLCKAVLQNANLENAWLNEVWLGRSHMEGANLTGALLMKADLGGASLDNVIAPDARFSNNLAAASLKGAQLEHSDFGDSYLREAVLNDSRLRRANFRRATLFAAKLQRADLTDAFLWSADLEDADFSGAMLEGALFFEKEGDRPGTSEALKNEPNFPSPGSGAFVRGAKFTGARGVSSKQREYLCRWGAVDVPGGCDGIARAEFPPEVPRRGDFSASVCDGGGF